MIVAKSAPQEAKKPHVPLMRESHCPGKSTVTDNVALQPGPGRAFFWIHINEPVTIPITSKTQLRLFVCHRILRFLRCLLLNSCLNSS